MNNEPTAIWTPNGLTSKLYYTGRGTCTCCRKAPSTTEAVIGTYDREPVTAAVCEPCAQRLR